jgi:ATP-dependent protease ClpP protease subunit
MAKEILLYGGVDIYSTTNFVKEMEANKDSDIVVRVHNSGGSPEDMFAIVAKFKEHSKGKKIKVDGMAYSAGLFALNYADEVEALDVSRGLLHRAAYPEWFEKSEYMTASMWENLDAINANLRKGFEGKIDVEAYNALGKPSLDDVFSNEKRIDVFLSAKEMKKIGLVDKIVSITPQKKAEINSMVAQMAASFRADSQISVEFEDVKPQNENKKMTKEQLKADNPAIYAEIFAEGVAQELDRVKACMTFVEVDALGVKAAIESGKNLTQSQMAEFAMKQVSAALLSATEKNAAADVNTPELPTGEPTLTAEQKALKEFEAKIDASLGIKTA